MARIHSLPSAPVSWPDTAAPGISAVAADERTDEVNTTDVAILPEEDLNLSTTNGDFPWLLGAGFAAVLGGIATAIFVPLTHGGNKDPRLH